MLVKCETKSNRVKGLSFHPKLSWILAALHNGTIQLWDYRIGSLIDKFEEHEGPVRGVDFHPSQQLFVSGGDDYKLKVWSYKQRRCLFTLLGHLDYVRTVQFHHEYPWILSASDDQTVRIWNWQSRHCIAVLTGHNHYVMCAQFHPKEDLVVSASLDQTVRVWDVSGLREKTVSIGGSGGGGSGGHGGDVFGATDAVVKYVLEGHDRGVNWASFHPSLPLIVSGADDRVLKLWRMGDSKAWEVDTLRGHFNNVSSCLFHPKKDLIISNSEDRTIRVWDVSKRTGIHTFRRENDRFWILAAHRHSNLLAVGHDSGMVVFKLDRERPPAAVLGDTLFFVQDKFLTSQQLSGDSSTSVCSVRRTGNAMAGGPKTMSVNDLNPTELNALLFFPEGEGGSYDLVVAPLRGGGEPKTTTGSGQSVAFVARNRFAVLDKGSIGVYNLTNEMTKRLEAPAGTERLFFGGNNKLILKAEEKMILFDLTNRKALGDITCPGGVRYVVWAPNGQLVAFLSKHNIILANSKLEYLFGLHENIRIKSGAWDENGVFVYSTLSHVKYALPNGDSGIIHSLTDPIYIMKVSSAKNQTLYFLDRDCKVNKKPLNSTEYLFKLALHNRNFNQVAAFIESGRLCGNAVIGFLKKKGHPEVALQFVEDPKTRFNLALEFGHLDEAIKAAQQVDSPQVWARLGEEALRQGNEHIVETVFQKTKSFERLSFLYLITGNIAKLRLMVKIADKRKDVMGRFHNALMLGDVEERVRVLAEVGQVSLAALTAQIHSLTELSQALSEAAGTIDVASATSQMEGGPALLIPPVPLLKSSGTEPQESNWPLLRPTKQIFEQTLLSSGGASVKNAAANFSMPAQTEAESTKNAFDELGGDDLGLPGDAGGKWADDLGADIDEALGAAGGDAWGAGDIDLPSPEGGDDAGMEMGLGMGDAAGAAVARNVAKGESAMFRWVRREPMVADLVAAGEFEQALLTLHKKIGLKNAAPLKPLFVKAFQAAFSFLPSLPQLPPALLPVLSSGTLRNKDDLPWRLYTRESVQLVLRDAYRQTTQGQFAEALNSFREALHQIPLCVADSSEEEATLREYITSAREYATAMRCELVRRELPQTDTARSIELAAYLTCCRMQPPHLAIALRLAMVLSFKAKNFITAASFARRLLQGSNTPPEVVQQTTKILSHCEQKATDTHTVNFDPTESDNLTICAETLTVIPAGAAVVRCPYCGAVCKVDFKKKVCPVCGLSELGVRVLGIQFRPVSSGR